MDLSNKQLQKPGSDPAGASSRYSFKRVPYHIKVLILTNISLFVSYFSTVDSSFLQNCMLASVYHIKYAAFYQKGSPLHLQKAEKGSISHIKALILLKIWLFVRNSSLTKNRIEACVEHIKYAAFYQKGLPCTRKRHNTIDIVTCQAHPALVKRVQ